MYIIFEDVHQFIGHCLIPLDPWLYQSHGDTSKIIRNTLADKLNQNIIRTLRQKSAYQLVDCLVVAQKALILFTIILFLHRDNKISTKPLFIASDPL